MNTLSKRQIDFLRVLGHFYLRHDSVDRAYVIFKVLKDKVPTDINILKSLLYASLEVFAFQETTELIEDLREQAQTEQDVVFVELMHKRLLYRQKQQKSSTLQLPPPPHG